jgi:hypothetical protein
MENVNNKVAVRAITSVELLDIALAKVQSCQTGDASFAETKQ